MTTSPRPLATAQAAKRKATKRKRKATKRKPKPKAIKQGGFGDNKRP